MVKPILRTIPSISGNVKLACGLSDYNKIDGTNFECYVRNAYLMPISHTLAEHRCEVALLGSSFEFDIKKFYAKYSSKFFDTCFDYNKDDLKKINTSEIQYPRNIDFEFGCSRKLFEKGDTQFVFYAPLWIDNANDLPDYFMLNIRIKNNLYDAERHIKIHINNSTQSDHNYLSVYLENYLKRIDGTCIFCLPKTGQATYYGIDVLKGGFKRAVDNIFNKNYELQNTINNFDAIISNGWKRNTMIVKQVMPLAFMFNLNDILSENDLKKYANAELYISGSYYKDGDELPMHDFSIDYTEFSQDVYQVNKKTGDFEYTRNDTNLMNVGFPALNDGFFKKYEYSNKLAPKYMRWKLKYSDDEHPYITNMSWAFSAIQGSSYKYGTFPESFKPINIISDSNNNLILPLGAGITSPSSPYYNDFKLQQNYMNILNNHAVSWFNVINDINDYQELTITNPSSIVSWQTYYKLVDGQYVEYTDEELEDIKYRFTLTVRNEDHLRKIKMYINKSIFSFDDWVDVVDDKAFCKGILYDLSKIYDTNPRVDHIDKFNVFVRIHFTKINKNDLPNIKNAKYTLFANPKYSAKNNCIVSDSVYRNLNDGGVTTNMSSLYIYDGTVKQYKHTLNFDALFLENKEGTGDFIDMMNYGIDLYEVNKYYKVSELINKLSTDEMLNFSYDAETIFTDPFYTERMTTGYEYLPIYRLDEVFDKNDKMLFKNEFQKHGDWITESMYFSQGNNYSKTEFENAALKVLHEQVGDERMAVSLYTKNTFVSYYTLCDILGDVMGENYGEWVDSYIGTFTEYEFNPLLEYNNAPYAKEVFTRRDTCTGKRYGDFIPRKYLDVDRDLIYVDTYNMNNVIAHWNDLHAKSQADRIPLYTNNSDYDYDIIDDYFDVLSDVGEEAVKYMFLEIGVNPGPEALAEFKRHHRAMACSSNNWNYVAMMAANSDTVNIYHRKQDDDGHYINVPAGEEENPNYQFTFNSDYAEGPLFLSDYQYETLNDNNSYEFYAKILDIDHLHWYMSRLYNNFDLDAEFDTSINSLYIKKRMVVNDWQNRSVVVKDVYTQLIDFYNPFVRLSEEQRIQIIAGELTDAIIYKKVNDTYYRNQSYTVTDDFETEDFYYYEDTIDPEYDNPILWMDKQRRLDVLTGKEHYRVFILNNDGEFEEIDYKNYKEYYIDVTQVSDGERVFADQYREWINDIKDRFVTDLVFNEELGYWEFNQTFNMFNDVDALAGIVEQDTADRSDFKFELYYKKRFIKLNSNLYKLMNVYGDKSNPYKDLYLYRIYDAEEYPEHLKFYYTENTDVLNISEETTRCLKPLFDSVYMQDREATVIYKEFNQSRVIPTTYAFWTAGTEQGVYVASTKEEVESVTGQTAIQSWCPWHVHYFWYSGVPVNGGIHTPTGFANYYRYDTENVTFMVDMSMSDLFTQEIDYKTGKPYQEWPIKGLNILTGLPANFYPKSYFNEYGLFKYEVPEGGAYMIRTYDLIDNCYSYLSCDMDDLNASKFKINSYTTYETTTYSYWSYVDVSVPVVSPEGEWNTYNVIKKVPVEGTYEQTSYTTYGFFMIDAFFDNTASSFNLVDTNYLPKKYFTYINENDIYGEQYSVADTFKLLVPMSKLTLTNSLYKENITVIKPNIYSTDSFYRQKPLYNDRNELYAYDIVYRKQPYGIVALERYFDSITPYIPQVSKYKNAYNLRYKEMDASVSLGYGTNVMYRTSLNIYNHEPLRVYDANNAYTTLEQPEYKYFNDNRLINLEESFSIPAGDNLSYDDMVALEDDKIVIDAFKNYINRNGRSSFNDDEILFLYNKYNVDYDSVCVGLNAVKTFKIYTLTYKFKLK